MGLPQEQKEPEKQEAKQEKPADSDEKERERHIYWDEGIHIVQLWDRLKISFGGGAQNDTAGFVETEKTEGKFGDLENETQWRRARLKTSGMFVRRFEFRLQYDFAANNPPNLKDAYLGIVDLHLPVIGIPFHIRGGRFKTPLGLETVTSSSDTTFMERGLTSAFIPSRNTGILMHGDFPRKRVRWALGFVQQEDDLDFSISGNYSLTGRFAGAFRPRKDDLLVHAGIDLARWVPSEGSASFSSRPESHIAPVFVDTGDFAAEAGNLIILEGAAIKGPLSFQGEAVFLDLDAPEVGDPMFYAFYVFGSYFLTGETRRYDSVNGAIRRIRPKREFRDGTGGKGAFEIAFRFSRIDMDDQAITGGRLNDITAGFNWYATRNYRTLFNVIRAERSDVDPVWIFQIRLQVAF